MSIFGKGLFGILFKNDKAVSSVPKAAAAPVVRTSPTIVYTPPPVEYTPVYAVRTTNNWFAAAADNDNNSVMTTVYDGTGKPLQLGDRDEKASGGEGIVYTYAANPKFLIKVYKSETLNDQVKMREIRQRIQDMVRISALANCDFLAWPLMPVFDSKQQIIGFVMRKCEGTSLLALRGPANIKRNFPQWDRADLAKIALDYVEKMKKLAACNVLVNDFNPSNFLVDKNGKVSFIDCDSFQIPSSRGGVNITTTYFASHVAPELLKDKSKLNCPRNIHHVEFGTALIVFHILMCGLHPYNYYDPSHKSACGTPDENLLKGRCPLGKGSGCRIPQGGWFNLWSYLTYEIKDAFISTFRKEEGHSNPDKRVDLDQLERELRKLLFEMKRDCTRRELLPQTAKPSTDYRNTKNSDIF